MKKVVAFIVIGLIVVIGVMAVRIKNDVQITTQSIKTEQNNAKDLQIKTYISKLRSALELYRADAGNYPESLSNLTPKYINPLPVNPYTSGFYDYFSSSNTYTLSAKLGNGTMYSQSNP